METWDAVRARRNVRQFEDRAISSEDLDRILEAGRRAPSASNWQPWDFVVVTDRSRLQRLSETWRGAKHVAGAAAAVVLVAPHQDDPDKLERVHYDLGQATLQMMIVAADLGVATAHARSTDEDLARELLGFPEDKFSPYMISLGYPTDGELAPLDRLDRRPFDEVVHRERF